MKTQQYNITGMSCAACSASVTKVVSRLKGVSNCEVNLITGKMTVTFNPKEVGTADFIRVVEKAGFGIIPEKEEKKLKEKTAQKSSYLPIIISALSSALLLYISMGQMLFENLPLPKLFELNRNPYNFAITQLLLCLPPVYFGRKFFTRGLALLIKGHPNMDSLVAIGAGASFIYSLVMTYTIAYNHHSVHNLYYESVAVVITLVMLGKFFEGKSRIKTADAIKRLIELSPDYATVIRDGKEYSVPTEKVNIGDILIIKTGEKIPLDAVVTEGGGSADESMLTGESLPVEKTVGDNITGGSLLVNGLIKARVTYIGENTTLSKIIKFVETAQLKKAPISKIADKVAGIFVPAVIAVSLISSVIWLICTGDLAFTLKIFTSVLVVACPCALGLATPTTIMVGTGLGATNGILIRNGEILEATHKIKIAVFDKTGTVTEGKPTVTDVISDNKPLLLKLLYLAESGSNHPLSKAVSDYCQKEGAALENTAEDYTYISGKGIKCTAEGKPLLVGSLSLLEDNGIDTSSLSEKAENLAINGKSVIAAAFDNKILGLLAVADTLKENSIKTFKRLNKMGIKTAILSGDNKLCAEYIGKLLNSDLVFSEVLPTEKAQTINRLKAEYGSVLMVGDGINDAPALTTADVGCAVGNGSDIAVESADIVLMKNDISLVPSAIKLSRLTITNIKQNLFWAFCYNTVLIPIAAGVLYPFTGVLLNPMLAGLAMSLSSVFVVGNALRLKLKSIK